MNDLSIIVFTNENYFNLLELTLPFLLDNTKHLQVNIYVVSNKIPQDSHTEKVGYINANVDFCEYGSHFCQTMLIALEQIEQDYILFLCDDYLIKSPIKKERFDNLPNLMSDLEADYLSLSTQKHLERFIESWRKPNINYEKYGFPKDCFFEFDETARHMYSVQPCVWKKKSLMTLLSYNLELTLHQLDNTDIQNTKGERRILNEFHNFSFYEKRNDFFDFGFKNFCYHYPPLTYHVDEKEIGSDFLLIDYIEIVRHGKFLDVEVNSKFILKKILESNDVKRIMNKLDKFF